MRLKGPRVPGQSLLHDFRPLLPLRVHAEDEPHEVQSCQFFVDRGCVFWRVDRRRTTDRDQDVAQIEQRIGTRVPATSSVSMWTLPPRATTQASPSRAPLNTIAPVAMKLWDSTVHPVR